MKNASGLIHEYILAHFSPAWIIFIDFEKNK